MCIVLLCESIKLTDYIVLKRIKINHTLKQIRVTGISSICIFKHINYQRTEWNLKVHNVLFIYL